MVNLKPMTISCKSNDCQMNFCYNMILNGRESVPETYILKAIQQTNSQHEDRLGSDENNY